MSMTLQQMIDFVRVHADADDVDAPDTTLTVYARIAYNDILARTKWPHLSVNYTFTTTAGQDRYPFSSFSTTDMEAITAVIDTTNFGRRLIYMSESDADIAFGQPVSITSEVATAYTVVNDALILYPTPGVTGKLYTVRGRRYASDWPNGPGSTPDLPASLHTAIAWYMLSSFYLAQEDPQMSGVYMGEYQMMVARHAGEESTREYTARPLVMGGQNYQAPDFTRWVRGMLE